MNRLFAGCVALLCMAPSSSYACAAEYVSGKVTRVIDGDTVVINSTNVQLYGVAAPGLNEPGGREARDVMVKLALGKDVSCELIDHHSGHNVASCNMHGNDLAWTMVVMGAARDCPRDSGGLFKDAELEALQNGATIRDRYTLPAYC
jgi:micrococcal nuclease